ncbi:CTB family bacteriocin [Acaryochloris sp. IP29b_bin.148]|uniref:CTB family bacteriocin n=1 Tax=Acaryochloris sp. IP29b_bin.148 TaxID=2969218 RepID=UPI002633ECFE|nr:CTB family bacteriocin [Acaryochloris sp. IP29b_bin.148]
MSELFTELSDQQQELVAGGAVTLLNINATSFESNTELLGATGFAASGPGGSTAAGNITGANQEIETSALNFQFGAVD